MNRLNRYYMRWWSACLWPILKREMTYQSTEKENNTTATSPNSLRFVRDSIFHILDLELHWSTMFLHGNNDLHSWGMSMYIVTLGVSQWSVLVSRHQIQSGPAVLCALVGISCAQVAAKKRDVLENRISDMLGIRLCSKAKKCHNILNDVKSKNNEIQTHGLWFSRCIIKTPFDFPGKNFDFLKQCPS